MPSTRALVEGKVATGMKEVDEEGRDPGDKDKDMDTLLGNKDKVQPPAVSQRGIVLAAIFYSACAATLLVFNKLAVRAVPSSSFNVAIQLLAAAVISRGLGIAGFVDCPGLQTKKVKKFLPVTVLFTLCLYTNVKALSGTSVNTLIVTRASTPIFVAVMDVVFLRTGWPSLMTWSSLVAIFVGAYLYALTDDGFSPGSYFWLGIYLVSLCTEMVYVKHIVDSVEMTTWERVYYNNLLGLPCSVLFGVAMNEFSSVKAEMFTSGTCYLILLTCFVSVAISFAGFNARKVMSATSFTVLGVANKAGSVILSALLIAAKVQPISYVCLFLCIFASTLFSQFKSTTPPMQCGRGSVVEEEDSLSEDEVRAKRRTRLINLWLNALLLAYTGFTIYTALPIIFPDFAVLAQLLALRHGYEIHADDLLFSSNASLSNATTVAGTRAGWSPAAGD